jgi:hypothetical protein
VPGGTAGDDNRCFLWKARVIMNATTRYAALAAAEPDPAGTLKTLLYILECYATARDQGQTELAITDGADGQQVLYQVDPDSAQHLFALCRALVDHLDGEPSRPPLAH